MLLIEANEDSKYSEEIPCVVDSIPELAFRSIRMPARPCEIDASCPVSLPISNWNKGMLHLLIF